jgi:hypothetical protein
MTAEEHIAFQLCAAMDVEPTQDQLGNIVGVLIRYKHAQKIATSHIERELKTARQEQHRLRTSLRELLEIEDARSGTGAFRPNEEAQRRISNARAQLPASGSDWRTP